MSNLLWLGTTYVHVHLCGLFPLITFVVNMMYLQIIYQHEVLQMPEMIKQKEHEVLQMPEMIKQKALRLAYVQVRYGITKNSPYISYGI